MSASLMIAVMSQRKTVYSVQQGRRKLAKIVKRVKRGEVIFLSRGGRVVAALVPASEG